ncbi:MAG: amidohydrolase [Alteromonadaceae bacterium]|nr:amidohydrolase [Alteromonadaceae bacterium]
MASELSERARMEAEAVAPAARDIAQHLWEWAEVGYQEHKSSELMQSYLRDSGFKITTGLAGIPTAFEASYGQSGPIIGILAEMDALPGMAHAPLAKKEALSGAGQACGHNLFAGGSVAAAIAVKRWLVDTGTSGQIRLYATPAEEGGAGKVYLARAGVFDDLDVALHWHPGDENNASPYTTLANKSAKFRFRGIASHAAISPHQGRSALDAVEAMNYMANLMREHIPETARIHYVITDGGKAPNIVPDFAEVYYYVRAPQASVVIDLWKRLTNAAEGAALGTGTHVDWEVVSGVWNMLPNIALARVMGDAMQQLGGISLTEDEQAFGQQIEATLANPAIDVQVKAMEVQPFTDHIGLSYASTDVGDVSWTVPTAGITTATWFSGVWPHTWQAAALSGTESAYKGMNKATEVIALTAMRLFSQPVLVDQAKAEFEQRKGEQAYNPLIGQRSPPLDYRKK